ncbi:MAG: hypothetical protein Q7S74_06170 [Nanoarchaeota archaeon]|nr:hypothetical protein [Nanoarchaeota archaeon]
MDNKHWLGYAHIKMREAGIRIIDFELTEQKKYGKEITIPQDSFDSVPLMSIRDFVGNERNILNERVSASRQFKTFIHKVVDEKAPYTEQIWEEQFGTNKPYLNIQLHRGIFLFDENDPFKVDNYRVHNCLSVDFFNSKRGFMEFFGECGEDFVYPFTPNMSAITSEEIKRSVWEILLEGVSGEGYKGRGVSRESAEIRQMQMSPQKYIDSAIPLILSLYKTIVD